jgi:hypothetical protein
MKVSILGVRSHELERPYREVRRDCGDMVVFDTVRGGDVSIRRFNGSSGVLHIGVGWFNLYFIGDWVGFMDYNPPPNCTI